MKRTTIAVALFATLSLATAGASASHNGRQRPVFDLGPIVDDLDRATDELYRLAERHADLRDFRDRAALRDVQGLMLRARGLRLALDDPYRLDERRLVFLIEGLVRDYDRVERAVRYFRMPLALDRYAEAGVLVSELDAVLAGAGRIDRRRDRFPVAALPVPRSRFDGTASFDDRWDDRHDDEFEHEAFERGREFR